MLSNIYSSYYIISTKQCFICQKGFLFGELILRYKNSIFYHPTCFPCVKCRKEFLDEILCDQCREEEKCNNNYGQRLFERFKHQLCYHQDNIKSNPTSFIRCNLCGKYFRDKLTDDIISMNFVHPECLEKHLNMDRLALLQFGLLLIAVPLQYFILTKWSSKDIEQAQAVNKIANQINQFFHYLSPNTWFNWFVSFVIEIPLGFNPLLHKRTWKRGVESPATEVYYMREKYGYFATSPAIRTPRSEYVKYRVGQVIRHKLYGYRGVIVGWDEIASAPDEWLDEHHQEHPEYRTQPNYSVLLDTRDRRAHKTYIPQEHIEVIKNTKIVNAQLSDYFNLFDGVQYIMQPWLQEQYPHD